METDPQDLKDAFDRLCAAAREFVNRFIEWARKTFDAILDFVRRLGLLHDALARSAIRARDNYRIDIYNGKRCNDIFALKPNYGYLRKGL